jgi:hypothetical protein
MEYFGLLPLTKYEEDGEGISLLSIIQRKWIDFDSRKSIKLKKIIEEGLPEKWEEDEVISSIVNEIMDHGMGYLYDRKVYIDSYRAKRSISLFGLTEQMPILRKVFIDMNGPCDLDGFDCNGLINNKCMTCLSGADNNTVFDFKKIVQCVDRILDMNVMEYVIMGGNPFGRIDELILIVDRIREKRKDVNITLQTIGNKLLNDENVEILKKNRMTVKFSILDLKECINYDNNICIIKKNIEKLDSEGIEWQIAFVGEENSLYLTDIKKHHIKIDIMCDTYSRDKGIGFVSVEERRVKYLDEYVENDKVIGCMDKILTISPEGRYKVCPYMDDITEEQPSDLDFIFQNHLQSKYWLKSKKSYFECKKCRYSGYCKNCMLLDEAVKQKSIALKDICNRK